MRGARKRRGSCRVPGHGQDCVLTREIREAAFTRAQEKADEYEFWAEHNHKLDGLKLAREGGWLLRRFQTDEPGQGDIDGWVGDATEVALWRPKT